MDKNIDYVQFFPKCGKIAVDYYNNLCSKCYVSVVTTELSVDDYFDLPDDEYKQWRINLFEKQIKVHPMFDAKLNYLVKCEEEGIKIPEEKHVPKCPTCGSTNLLRVNGSNTGWVGTFGTISMNKNAGKTFECVDCGYKW